MLTCVKYIAVHESPPSRTITNLRILEKTRCPNLPLLKPLPLLIALYAEAARELDSPAGSDQRVKKTCEVVRLRHQH